MIERPGGVYLWDMLCGLRLCSPDRMVDRPNVRWIHLDMHSICDSTLCMAFRLVLTLYKIFLELSYGVLSMQYARVERREPDALGPIALL